MPLQQHTYFHKQHRTHIKPLLMIRSWDSQTLIWFLFWTCSHILKTHWHLKLLSICLDNSFWQMYNTKCSVQALWWNRCCAYSLCVLKCVIFECTMKVILLILYVFILPAFTGAFMTLMSQNSLFTLGILLINKGLYVVRRCNVVI